jgi:hypothetical protein
MNPTREYKPERLTPAQVERAALASPYLYPQDCPCARCGFRWMQHKGLLCPATEGKWSTIQNPHTGMPYVIPPTFSDQTFIPDEAYYREPEFDVA